MGTQWPGWFHIAVPETISTIRSPRPYHPVTNRRRHRVFRLARRCLRLGRRLPTTGGRPTDLTGQSPWRRFVERSIEPPAGDHGEPWSHVVEQVDRGEAGIADANEASVRQPQRRLDQYLPGPVGKLLVLPLSLFMLIPIALRGGQDGQERQCPATPGPGDLRQQHDREPAQAARLDEMTV